MFIAQLRRFLMSPVVTSHSSSGVSLLGPGVFWWLFCSLVFAAICGGLGLKKAFRAEYVVPDDARQHVFWMGRFQDPGLFPRDLIADYFQSVAPYGYATFYRLMAAIGIPPLLCSKLLPPVLGGIATVYCFGLCLQILPVPFSAFVTTLMLNQNLWMRDDLVSATPRAFVYPLLLAFLYYLSRRSLAPCLVAIALQGLFYPQIVTINVGILVLRLLRWEQGRLRLSHNKEDYRFCAAALAVALLCLLPFLLRSSEFGPTVTATAARTWLEMAPGGRVPFFDPNPWRYWIWGPRSGLLPRGILTPPILLLGFSLPILLRFPHRFGLVKHLADGPRLFAPTILSSLGMFLAAHALLFRLHLPNRYTRFSLTIVIAVAAGMALTLIAEAILHRAEESPGSLARLLIALPAAGLVALLMLHPFAVRNFPSRSYVVGRNPKLYQYFAQQPKGVLIASTLGEAGKLPIFSQRSVLVAREYGIPYQIGYYGQFHQRMADLIRAQYTPDLATVKHFLERYGVDYWLLSKDAFTPEYIAGQLWRRYFRSEADQAIMEMTSGRVPALARLIESCSVFREGNLVVLDAGCLRKAEFDGRGNLDGRHVRSPRPLAERR